MIRITRSPYVTTTRGREGEINETKQTINKKYTRKDISRANTHE